MLKQKLMIGDVDTSAYGVYVTDAGVYTPVARQYDMVSIAGRNGDLEIDNGRFANGIMTYPAVITDDFSKNYIAFKSKLNSIIGYTKISDEFMPEYYRMGIFVNDSDVKLSRDNSLGSFNLKFNVKPQLFFKSGDKSLNIVNPTAGSLNETYMYTLKNPTGFITKPLLRIYGTGYLTIGSSIIRVITAGNEYIDFDCETMNAYEGSESRNSNISISSLTQPKLVGNINRILLRGVDKIELIPRWYTVV